MNTLHQLNPTAAAYLRNIPSQFWVAAFIPGRRYGQDTSNIVERINFDFKALCELPIVELLQTLWHKVITVRYQRYPQATTHTAYPMHTELRLANIKFNSQVLLQKIPPILPATIKSTSKPNNVLAINLNIHRMIYHVHMPLLYITP